MEKLILQGPIVQVAIDMLTIDAALKVADAAVKAGADWLEAGTPLITFAGTEAIGAIARAYPEKIVLADYKMMDGVRKYVLETAKQGGRICTICAVASDASILEAGRAAKEAGVTLVSDLYACADPAARAVEIQEMGVDAVYVHWGSDQRNEKPDRDPLISLAEVVKQVRIPVGVGTFSVADGIRAFELGADFVVIGYPLIGVPDVESALREYIVEARAAYWNRRKDTRIAG